MHDAEHTDQEIPGQNMRFSDIVLDDARLSMAAKGVFATLGLLGNDCEVEALARHTSDGGGALAAALQELSEAGYVTLDERRVRVSRPGSFGQPA